MMKTITDKEISQMVNKAPSTIARWKKNNPSLYESVYIGSWERKFYRLDGQKMMSKYLLQQRGYME